MEPTRPGQHWQPACTGSQWVHQPIWPCELVPAGLPGLLLITTDRGATVYVVSAVGTADGIGSYRLTESDGKVTDIVAKDWTCACSGGTCHSDGPGGCRHVIALDAALARIGVPVPRRPVARPFHSSADVARNAPEVLPG